MAYKLLIVESPAKAKTINKYLGQDLKVLASFGHIRDLPKKNGSIDVDNDFQAKYQLISRNKKHVDEIIASAKNATTIYLATDPDREGEAIAWHINQVLLDSGLANKPISRVTFNQITKQAVIDSIKKHRAIDPNLVDAQQSRLTLDYLLGFNLSPLLWRKVRPGLSAGRVQSPALRLICEREDEIISFIPEDYFGIHLHSHKNKIKFSARLISYRDQKIELRTLNKQADAEKVITELSIHDKAQVLKINKKQKNKNPQPPFITSSLQIEASRQLGFTTDKTMRVAQSLYEGVQLDGEGTGLITYMRTDSVQIAASAIDEIRVYIGQSFPKQYLPEKANLYVTKAKNAQEAHEAIRPTVIDRTPESIKNYLTPEQYRLYELIWRRSLASQLSPAILDTTAIDIKLDTGTFRLNGIMVNFDGYMRVYQESVEDKKADDADIKLPELVEGEMLVVDQLELSAHQTEPKPRYSEASLVKTLEELGIGRPSTYASIIATLKKREYVVIEKKRFSPTEIGTIVNQFLKKHFTKYVDYQFTANLEDTLDEIADGSKVKLPVLKQFWQELSELIQAKQGLSKLELTGEKLDEECPECGKGLVVKLGKYGRFIGCSGYPECNYMAKMDKAGGALPITPPEEIPDRQCPNDGGKLLIREGRYGKFISCANYPKCKYIEGIDKSEQEHAITCPECNVGKIVSKKGRFGIFYSCNNYPQCKTIFKYQPVAESCPACSYPVMMLHSTKTKGAHKICPKCKHTISCE